VSNYRYKCFLIKRTFRVFKLLVMEEEVVVEEIEEEEEMVVMVVTPGPRPTSVS
jgi:hypothetical protein